MKKTHAEELRDSGLDQKIVAGSIKILLTSKSTSSDYQTVKGQFNKLQDGSPAKRLMMAELEKHGFRFRPARAGEKYQCLKLDDSKVHQGG